MYDFEFIKPASLDEALAALEDEDAQALAGGQTLIPTLRQRLAMPTTLVSLRELPELRGVTVEDGILTLGAATTHAQIARDIAEIYPALASLASKVGDPSVRTLGTIGGSLANNDPSACYPAAALASKATVITNQREIAADAFFEGLFTTALEPEELIVSIRFPIPSAGSYQKFRQPASRFPLTGVFVARHENEVHIAVTGASEDGVYRWQEAEDALAADFTPEAVDPLTVSPEGMISDMHGTPEYRANLVKVLTQRGVGEAGRV
ncbi:MAG: xanthine dehydrogenase family protein subunit M [Pseudomonadota bacterium]